LVSGFVPCIYSGPPGPAGWPKSALRVYQVSNYTVIINIPKTQKLSMVSPIENITRLTPARARAFSESAGEQWASSQSSTSVFSFLQVVCIFLEHHLFFLWVEIYIKSSNVHCHQGTLSAVDFNIQIFLICWADSMVSLFLHHEPTWQGLAEATGQDKCCCSRHCQAITSNPVCFSISSGDSLCKCACSK
jgi:hypothetical protein